MDPLRVSRACMRALNPDPPPPHTHTQSATGLALPLLVLKGQLGEVWVALTEKVVLEWAGGEGVWVDA